MKLSKLLEYLEPYKWHSLVGAGFKLIEAILELFLPLIMARAIDKSLATGDTDYIIKMGLIMVAIVLFALFCATICQYLASVASQGFGTEVRNALFEKINTLSFSQLDEFGVASLINRLTGDVNQIQFAVAMLIRLVIRAPFLSIGGIIMAMSIDLRLSIIIILALPIFVLLISLIMRVNIKLHRNVQAKLDRLTLILRENLSGIRVIRAFAKNDDENIRFKESVDEHTAASLKIGRISALLNPATQLIMNFAILLIIWFGGFRVKSNNMTTGEIIAFINYINQILIALIVVANLVITFTRSYSSANRIMEILELDEEIKDGQVLLSDEDEDYIIEFRDVIFSYEGAVPDLYNIDFKIRAGDNIGIIGGTGSGKTSIINLIMRFYDTRDGEVYLKGKNIKDYKQEDVRKIIGLVPQKAELFSGTVRDNISWGKIDASLEEVEEAGRKALVDEFIDMKEEGYDYYLERGGLNLSGGQRQRVTIARALVKKPEILILDDSSSALDYVTDAKIRNNIYKMVEKDKLTSIMISQRVSTIKNSDLILVMDNGNLVGKGSHDYLLENCRQYKEIVKSQENKKGAN